MLRKSFFLVILTLVMAACSRNDSNLYKYASADAVFVATGDPATLLQNMGCTIDRDGVKVGEALERLVNMTQRGANRQKTLDQLRMPGVDLENALMTCNENSETLIAVALNDRSAFEKWLDETLTDVKHEGDVYELGYRTWLVVNDAEAVMLNGKRGNVSANELLESFVEAAKNSPLTSWQIDALGRSNLYNIVVGIKALDATSSDMMGRLISATNIGYDQESLAEGFFVVNAELEGLDLNVRTHFCDKDGKNLEYTFADMRADVSLLEYANDDPYLVVLTAVPEGLNWTQTLNEIVKTMGGYRNMPFGPTDMAVIASVLQNIDGSFMISGKPVSLSGVNSLAGWEVSIAAQMRPGKAAEYVNGLRTLCELGKLQSTWDGETLTAQIPEQGTCYATTRGDVIVLATAPITGKGKVGSAKGFFKDTCGGIWLDIPRENVFSALFNMPFGILMNSRIEGSEVVMNLSLTDTNGKMFENILQLVPKM